MAAVDPPPRMVRSGERRPLFPRIRERHLREIDAYPAQRRPLREHPLDRQSGPFPRGRRPRRTDRPPSIQQRRTSSISRWPRGRRPPVSPVRSCPAGRSRGRVGPSRRSDRRTARPHVRSCRGRVGRSEIRAPSCITPSHLRHSDGDANHSPGGSTEHYRTHQRHLSQITRQKICEGDARVSLAAPPAKTSPPPPGEESQPQPPPPFPAAALTIATIPARIDSGNVGHEGQACIPLTGVDGQGMGTEVLDGW